VTSPAPEPDAAALPPHRPGRSGWKTLAAGECRSASVDGDRDPSGGGESLLTAVDARSGEPVVLDRHRGVDLVDAVAASCASAFAYRIGDEWYVDGGYRRGENADLAAGSRRVLVLAPFGGRTRAPRAWGLHLAAQVDELRARGSAVEVVVPGAAADHLFGPQAMDLTLRPESARAGHARGTALAERVAALWD